MHKIKQLISAGIYILFFLILIVCMKEKTNLHTDEVSTYVLANNAADDAIVVNPQRGVVYTKSKQAFLDNMTVAKGDGLIMQMFGKNRC